MASNIFSQIFGVPSTNISVEQGDRDGFQMYAGNITLPPIQYSEPESDAELEPEDPDERQHIYRPLKRDEIRLLILNPGTEDEPTECYLEHYPVGSAKPYLALSYVWGSTENPGSILLDGCTFQVTANLGAFLKSIRHEFSTQVFWIDALCINQQDVQEKGHQIRLMKRVYEGASQIVIWLGEPDQNTKPAFDYLKHNYSEEEEWSSAMGRLRIESEQVIKEIPPEALDGIQDLLARPWWTRIWVYQEATAPARRGSRVYCGKHQVDFEDLRECIRDLCAIDSGKYSNRTALIMDEYSRIRRFYNKSGTTIYLHLADLLPTLRGFQATNPRDKLYALIPTSIDGNDLLDVDYSLSVEEVYMQSTCNIVQADKSLDFLGHCTQQDDICDLDLPTWVPDWTQRESALHLFKRGPDGKLYNACESLLANFEFDTGNRILKTIGKRFGTVEYISPSQNDTVNETSLLKAWRDWLAKVDFVPSSPQSPYHPSPQVEDILLSTLVSDCDRIGLDLGLRLPRTESGNITEETKMRIMQAIETKSNNALTGLHPAFIHRKLILTEGGYLGLTAKHAQKGDVVTILGGTQVPMVLRRNGDHFNLIGEAYIHGIMDGEAGRGERTLELEMFHIL
ncbi:heterokaryon incompatibility protein-domain-containing protein [Clohesyomyces aquaticus]|uniref:Heterokaryon incompatibility protein-domain-containing protein n=1 Tax=Clohesyomyces aquaticus TaxID=1231657 RepID=A0A1Y1ZXK2_9PLEO|nr:heterokaryon incompatibility protein-domain-containing protein [Clohesyomyces aquaticus]